MPPRRWHPQTIKRIIEARAIFVIDGLTMRMTKLYIAALLATILTGCANREVLLINDKGERRYCYEVHDSGIERFAASEHFNKCLNDAGTAGFQRQ